MPSPTEKSGLLATLGEREVLRLLGISALVQLSFDLFPLFIPIYGRSIGISPSTIGYIVGAVFVAAFGIQLVLARVVRRLGERDILTFSFGVAMCCFLGMPLAAGALSLGAIACVFGIAMGAGHPVTSMLLSSRAPKGRPAETLGFRLSINYTLRFVGPTALGTLGTALRAHTDVCRQRGADGLRRIPQPSVAVSEPRPVIGDCGESAQAVAQFPQFDIVRQ